VINKTQIYNFPNLTFQFTVQKYSHSRNVEKLKQQGFVLQNEGKPTNFWFCGLKLPRLYHNFNYILSFGITVKGYQMK
jgi:hypothetical protein